jgi:hypothetical protein
MQQAGKATRADKPKNEKMHGKQPEILTVATRPIHKTGI